MFSFQLYVNSRYAKPRFKKFGFEIYDTGNMYLIRSPAGLKLQWYHSTGMLVIETDSSSNKHPTMGLCGKSRLRSHCAKCGPHLFFFNRNVICSTLIWDICKSYSAV